MPRYINWPAPCRTSNQVWIMFSHDHLGHQNGCVTLWTPNLPHPAVQLLAHLGPVVSVSVDPSQGGRYMAKAGRDGTVKVWDCRRGGDPEFDWSAKEPPVVELSMLFVMNNANAILLTDSQDGEGGAGDRGRASEREEGLSIRRQWWNCC